MLRLLYWLYAFRLRRQIGSHPVPRHVGIILDGNRRYARKHNLTRPRVAYDLGAKKLDDLLSSARASPSWSIARPPDPAGSRGASIWESRP